MAFPEHAGTNEIILRAIHIRRLQVVLLPPPPNSPSLPLFVTYSNSNKSATLAVPLTRFKLFDVVHVDPIGSFRTEMDETLFPQNCEMVLLYTDRIANS